MMLKRTGLAVMLTVFVCAQADAQTFDFEDGIPGWAAAGDAFQNQPVDGSRATTDDFAGVTVGGDYWRGLQYPLGQSGRLLVVSSASGTGSLTSPLVTPPPAARYVTALVGGSPDLNRVRLELLVSEGTGDVVAARTAAAGSNQLSQQVLEIPDRLRGRPMRIRIVDSATDARISVDRIQWSEQIPSAPHVPVWGFADLHTHPMNYLAFGGLNGVRAIWGVAGGGYADYEKLPRLIERDLPPCIQGHGGGITAEAFINGAEGRFDPDLSFPAVLKTFFTALFWPAYIVRHGSSGASGFHTHPSFRYGMHYQTHITQIRRAWEGGLRLMMALAIHNQGVEYLMSPIKHGGVVTTSDRQVLDAQVCGIRQLVELNHDWMEIAYSAADARRIIAAGKLAIVLGAELDQFGELAGFDSADEEIQYLWDLGIRHVTPIHAVDNRLGGASMFEPAYNSLNDLLHRGPENFNARPDQLLRVMTSFMQSKEKEGCGQPHDKPLGECVTYRFEPEQNRPVIMRSLLFLYQLTSFITGVNAYDGKSRGMANMQGLTTFGQTYIGELIDRGMLVGLEHMSAESVEGVYSVVGSRAAAKGHPECADLSHGVSEACAEYTYPLYLSHAHFRRLSPVDSLVAGHPGEYPINGQRPSEYEVGDGLADLIKSTGGLVGQFVAEDPLTLPPDVKPPVFPNDCAGSSKSFAYSLTYALHKLGRAAIATDYTIITSVSPRFGPDACWAARPGQGRQKDSPAPDQYKRGDQKNRVIYDGGGPRSAADLQKVPLKPYRMGDRTSDFNVDGLAHYGLLPDLFQDLENLGISDDVRGSLFSSAEAFLMTWEKAERLSGRSRDGFIPRPLPCETACRGMCPMSPGAGAPLQARHAQP